MKHAANAISCAQDTKVRKLYRSETLILQPSDERASAGNVWDWTIDEAHVFADIALDIKGTTPLDGMELDAVPMQGSPGSCRSLAHIIASRISCLSRD
ncbi:hypothetical protein [Rhizobium sp. CNPSo 3490]|uniref:hypothetical protein n=1 Tax=Rhizobium sp. CNPSo 3490 TaxID=3021407 RepID=UPI00254E1C15|nr:hypothetical protein [Rhizobium sp. CNPSo 3490]MDK4734886.1 hypothetical protein [Rhizobium sp. CNPSo 3490]